jgi:hypothetical protein
MQMPVQLGVLIAAAMNAPIGFLLKHAKAFAYLHADNM